jgi:hypothetical protein
MREAKRRFMDSSCPWNEAGREPCRCTLLQRSPEVIGPGADKWGMRPLTNAQAYAIAAATGAGLWIAVTLISGRREAWDSPLYWMAGYPAGIAVAGVLGYLAPERPWRWALALMSAQSVTLAFAASSFGLLPLGLIMFGILALPGAGVAAIAAATRRRALS